MSDTDIRTQDVTRSDLGRWAVRLIGRCIVLSMVVFVVTGKLAADQAPDINPDLVGVFFAVLTTGLLLSNSRGPR